MKNIAISLSPAILADQLSEETRSTHNMHSSHSCHTSNHQHHHQFFSCIRNQTGAINRNFGNIRTHFIIIHISFIISSSLDLESCGEQSPPSPHKLAQSDICRSKVECSTLVLEHSDPLKPVHRPTNGP